MADKTLHDLFIEELRDIYHAEKQLARALPRLSKAADNAALRQAIESHTEQTNGQIERLEKVFEALDTRSRGKRCEAMEGLIEEAREMLEMALPPDVRDAALIAAAQKIEHYEIASYGTLHAYAQALGHKEAVGLLRQTLDEEKAADTKLNEIAVKDVNAKAVSSQKAA
jgi:ferritin-like metal-binding protein YciE